MGWERSGQYGWGNTLPSPAQDVTGGIRGCWPPRRCSRLLQGSQPQYPVLFYRFERSAFSRPRITMLCAGTDRPGCFSFLPICTLRFWFSKQGTTQAPHFTSFFWSWLTSQTTKQYPHRNRLGLFKQGCISAMTDAYFVKIRLNLHIKVNT
jgi:hypothetical protein